MSVSAASWLSYTQPHEPLSDSASPVLEGKAQEPVTRFSHLLWASLLARDGEGKRFPPNSCWTEGLLVEWEVPGGVLGCGVVGQGTV